MGVQPHSWEPRLPPPARPVREREQSSEPPFGRCDCHRETLPRMLSALLGWLRSQLSSWAVRWRGGTAAGGWRGPWSSRGSELSAGHRALGMRWDGWLRGGAVQPQCSKSPSTGALPIRWKCRREATLLGLRVLLSKRDASLPSRSGCASSAGPRWQGSFGQSRMCCLGPRYVATTFSFFLSLPD